jgi:hypothetical protein
MPGLARDFLLGHPLLYRRAAVIDPASHAVVRCEGPKRALLLLTTSRYAPEGFDVERRENVTVEPSVLIGVLVHGGPSAAWRRWPETRSERFPIRYFLAIQGSKDRSVHQRTLDGCADGVRRKSLVWNVFNAVRENF